MRPRFLRPGARFVPLLLDDDQWPLRDWAARQRELQRTSDVGQVGQALTNSAVRFNFVKTADWGTGYNARVDITNLGPDVIRGWQAAFDLPIDVNVNISSLPSTAWSLFNTRGIENEVRINQSD